MACPTSDWLETLTALAACGAVLVITSSSSSSSKHHSQVTSHPLMPTLRIELLQDEQKEHQQQKKKKKKETTENNRRRKAGDLRETASGWSLSVDPSRPLHATTADVKKVLKRILTQLLRPEKGCYDLLKRRIDVGFQITRGQTGVSA
mmetsp:Transcript_37139/g.71664  ORF Transcript_37139/g.71664 Transcript_37139/m.71664 type:complete len:148 (-) Transcript_37139:211-654(-)